MSYQQGNMIPKYDCPSIFKTIRGLPTIFCSFVILLWCSKSTFCKSYGISPEKCLVWGPGLDPEVVLPVRYFYIQAVNSAGMNFTKSPGLAFLCERFRDGRFSHCYQLSPVYSCSTLLFIRGHYPGKDSFRVRISSLSIGEHIRIHVPQPLDRTDGSFLLRYRLYGSASKGLKVEVLSEDQPVGQSPYILQGPVYHEYCDCPEANPPTWLGNMACPTQEPQILKDFSSFPSIDLQRLLKEVPRRFAHRGGLIHYTISNNQVYRRAIGKYTDFKMFSDEMLLSLARKVRLPDVEFYINVGDWPMETRKVNDTPGPLPIISWCGSADTRDIILPTYDITHSTLETMRGVSNDLLSVQGNTGPPWINKTGQAFFRGRDSREERLHLVSLSRENPELLDAGITGYFFFREKEKELGRAPLTGFFNFFKYKYQVNVDGTVAAYRFPYLMLGDSLVLKQNSPYYEHFYIYLQPGKHYVPVQRSLIDLIDKIKWAKKNDAVVQAIAREGQILARELLQPSRLYCYYYTVLQMYAEHQASPPTVHQGMDLVPQPSDHTALCRCERKTQGGEPASGKDEL